MMKIAIMISSFAVGGAENMVAQLIAGLDKTSFELIVITSNPKQNTHIQNIVDKSCIKFYSANKTDDKSLFSRLKTFWNVCKILKREKPDLIHTNLSIIIYAIPYILFHKVAFIHTVHNLPSKDLGNNVRLVLKCLVKLKKIRFTSISKSIQSAIVSEYGVEKSLAPIIVNPVNCKEFDVKPIRCANHCFEKIRFVNVGRLSLQKNQELLIKAFSHVVKKYDDISLDIVGSGDLSPKLNTLVEKLNLNSHVFFKGSRSDIPQLLASSDIFVLSSIYEGLPLTILEAEASGLPIISTDVGGVSDVVENEKNGLLVPNNDEKSLANAMIHLIEHDELRVLFGNQSKEIVKKYDINCFINQYSSLYRKTNQ